jgi:hypothetical protein
MGLPFGRWFGSDGVRAVLAQRRDLGRPPGPVEVRLEQAVEAHDREPALAFRRLDPVASRLSDGCSGLNVTVLEPSSFAIAAGEG